MEKNFDLIKKLRLFKEINIDDIPSLLSLIDANIKVYEKDEPVFLEGQKTSSAGIILYGSAYVVKEDFKGNRNIIYSLIEGQMFGEALCCTEVDVIPVSIYASNNCAVLHFKIKPILDIKELRDYSTQFFKNLLEIIAEKNLNLRAKVNIISRRTTREKIMAYLLDFSKEVRKSEFVIPFDRQGLADYLGVERSAMSYEISKLCKEGIISTNKSRFTIIKDSKI